MIAEKDPNGADPHTPGAKLDHGKPRAGLVLMSFGKALLEVSRVGTFGAEKYTEKGWIEVDNGCERYMDSAFRHLLVTETESFDPESKLSHLSHAAWNILACLELKLRGNTGHYKKGA